MNSSEKDEHTAGKRFELLEKINSPEDLRKLAPEQLPQLCGEIREFLIDSLSVSRGILPQAWVLWK